MSAPGQLDPELMSLAQRIAGNYPERARLAKTLLDFEPSAAELATLWAMLKLQLERVNKEPAVRQNPFWRLPGEWFDGVMEWLIGLTGQPAPALSLGWWKGMKLRGILRSTLSKMHGPRFDSMMPIVVELSANALRLSQSTVELIGRQLDPASAIAAQRTAIQHVGRNPDFSAFEKMKAEEWLRSVDWSFEKQART